MVSLICALIIIIILFCFNLYSIGRIRKLEILNMNYIEKLNRLEELKSIDKKEIDELANEHFEQYIKTATHTVGGYIDGLKQVIEKQ